MNIEPRFAHRYTDPAAAWANPSSCTRPKLTASNDNVPPSPPYRREPEQVLAWPTMERLAYAKDLPRVKALQYWRDLIQPHNSVVPDNADDADEETGDLEFELETRPTEPGTLTAIGWKVTGSERWHFNGKMVKTYERADIKPVVVPECPPEREHIQLGDLRFRGNELVEWGRTAATKANPDGKPLKPIERLGEPMGKPTPKRTEAAIWKYIKLGGAVANPMDAKGLDRVLCSPDGAGGNGTYYDPLPGTVEARAELERLMKSGPPITKCPDALVTGHQWRGGIPAVKGSGGAGKTTEPDIGHSNTGKELARTVEAEWLRKELGPIADVLDLAITDATAKDVGKSVGYTESSAEKYGSSVIDKALDALITVAELPRELFAANDNHKIEEKQAA